MLVNMLKFTKQQIPQALLDIPAPPSQLYVAGDLKSLLDQPLLAVIGSRKTTPYGQIVTRSLLSDVVQRGVVIVSGLAVGIDGLAHRMALENGGRTIAVL